MLGPSCGNAAGKARQKWYAESNPPMQMSFMDNRPQGGAMLSWALAKAFALALKVSPSVKKAHRKTATQYDGE